MIVSAKMERLPRASGLVAWVRSIAAKLVRKAEFQDINGKEFQQIARDLNLSVSELYAVTTGRNLACDLLSKRLVTSGLSLHEVRHRHPAILRDLQRTCANCDSTGRCARELSRPDSKQDRSDYCPNTHALQALEQEQREASLQATLPLGPCCC